MLWVGSAEFCLEPAGDAGIRFGMPEKLSKFDLDRGGGLAKGR